MGTKKAIKYIEFKGGVSALEARIGNVSLSKSGRTLRYKGREFSSLKGQGFKANYYDIETGDHYWISNCRKDGNDGLYNIKIYIDDDIREKYWREIRNLPNRINQDNFVSRGKHRVGRYDLKNKTGNV